MNASTPPSAASSLEKMAKLGSPRESDTTVNKLSAYSTRVPDTVAK